MRHQEALGCAIVMQDPGVEHVAMAIGGAGNPSNTGRMFITLKPRDQRTATADQIITRLVTWQLAKVEGGATFPSGVAGRHRRRTGRAHAISAVWHAAGFRLRRVEPMGFKMLAKMQTLPELR